MCIRDSLLCFRTGRCPPKLGCRSQGFLVGGVSAPVAPDFLLDGSLRSLTILNAVPEFMVLIQSLPRRYTPVSQGLSGARICHRKLRSDIERLPNSRLTSAFIGLHT